jgi:uncharacterized protein (TIGR02679 family)
MKTQLQEALEFFKSNSGFDRTINSMYDVYAQYSRSFGAVRITNPSEKEENALSEFFKRDYYNQALIRIGLAEFERQMQKKFSDEVSLSDVLGEYVGSPFITRSSRAVQKPNSFAMALHESVIPQFENTPAESWLKEIATQSRRAYRTHAAQFLTDPESIVKMLRETAEAVNNISPAKQLVPLAEFSQKYTGSPTAFNFSEMQGALFLRALACKYKLPAPTSTEDCISLHLRAGLLSRGMLSSVIVRGLGGDFTQSHVLTLENLCRYKNASAFCNKVFVLDDPQIYAEICESLGELPCTIICPHNGHNAAFTYVLNLLHEANIPFRYAGSFNYKGLELADKLFVRYDKNCMLWRFTLEDFKRVLSEGTAAANNEKGTLAMHNETLASLLSFMRKVGKTATSAPLVPLYIDDIKNAVQ